MENYFETEGIVNVIHRCCTRGFSPVEPWNQSTTPGGKPHRQGHRERFTSPSHPTLSTDATFEHH